MKNRTKRKKEKEEKSKVIRAMAIYENGTKVSKVQFGNDFGSEANKA